MLVWCVSLSGLWSAVIKFGLSSVFNNNPQYVDVLNKSMTIRFDIAFLVTGCVALTSMLWYNLQEQKETELRKADTEKLSKDAELFKLRQQLQPHFLFNSLNSINALIGNQPAQARKMIHQLSDFLRGTLKKEENEWVSADEEFQHLQLYLEIEKVRFGHRLNTKITLDESGGPLYLPAMLLQPIVENAIKFGLYDTTEDVTIYIEAKKTETFLVISVQNPFDPQTSSPRQGTGFGLNSVQRRLYLLFGRNDLLTTEINNNLFITTVKIPQHDKSHINR